MSRVPLYDEFSEDYDRFVDWPARLSFEMPFLKRVFEEEGVHRILDVACGTGQHASAFANVGYDVAAADLSEAMVDRARANAAEAGVDLAVERLGFGELHSSLSGSFDAITCLGNSLPHLVTEDALIGALQDMAALLRPGGVLIAQNRNFDKVLAGEERFMSPEEQRADDGEWIFFRFYDFDGPHLRFNVVRLYCPDGGQWQARLGHTRLRAWRRSEMEAHLATAGFGITEAYGSYRGEPFDPRESSDLLVVARR